MFVEWASYHWVFWFVAIVAAPVALAGIFLIPPPQVAETTDSLEPTAAKWKSLDLVGISIITSMNVSAHSFFAWLTRLDSCHNLIHLRCYIRFH
jgi:predicted MFS family arabinose efflux permease